MYCDSDVTTAAAWFTSASVCARSSWPHQFCRDSPQSSAIWVAVDTVARPAEQPDRQVRPLQRDHRGEFRVVPHRPFAARVRVPTKGTAAPAACRCRGSTGARAPAVISGAAASCGVGIPGGRLSPDSKAIATNRSAIDLPRPPALGGGTVDHAEERSAAEADAVGDPGKPGRDRRGPAVLEDEGAVVGPGIDACARAPGGEEGRSGRSGCRTRSPRRAPTLRGRAAPVPVRPARRCDRRRRNGAAGRAGVAPAPLR